MKEHYIRLREEIGISDMAHALESWLKEHGMETQVFRDLKCNYVVQARRRRGDAAMMLGMDKTLCVSISMVGEGLARVRTGSGVWKDKAAAAAASLVFCWPLIITSAFGTADQLLLMARAMRFMKNYAAGGHDIEH